MQSPETPSLIRVHVEPAPSPTDPPDADEFYKALGVAVIAWGRLEGHFTALLIGILNISQDKRIGKKLPMRREQCSKIWRLAFGNVPNLFNYRSEALTFLDEMDALAEKRHRIVHALWGLFVPGSPLSINVAVIKARSGTSDGLLYGRSVYTVGWLEEFAAEANRLNLALLKIGGPIIALRGEPPKSLRIL